MKCYQGRNASIVYGICTNTGGKKDGTPCSRCQNKEKQAVRASKEFVCEECGEPLTKVDLPSPKPLKWIYMILVLAVVCGGIWVFFGFFTHPKPQHYDAVLSLNKSVLTLDAGACDTLKATVSTTPESPTENVSVSFTSDNTNVVQVDDAGVVRAVAQGETIITVIALAQNGATDTAKVSVMVNDPPKPEIESPQKSPKKNHSSNIDQGWYTWEGSITGGQPHGKGIMRITRAHTIELVDITGSKLTVYPGETINAMFDNGRLRGGDIIHKDGSSTTFVNHL